MTQQTRNTIANALLALCVVFLAVFVAQHFMTSPRPSWHKDLVMFGLICVIASRMARGREAVREKRHVVASLSLIAIIVILFAFVS